jgi:hypothetical protein
MLKYPNTLQPSNYVQAAIELAKFFSSDASIAFNNLAEQAQALSTTLALTGRSDEATKVVQDYSSGTARLALEAAANTSDLFLQKKALQKAAETLFVRGGMIFHSSSSVI